MLKKEAKRRRLSVSHLIRNVLEDTYKLVDGVISDVDDLVHDSVALTGRVRREAQEIARAAAARDVTSPTTEPPVIVVPPPASPSETGSHTVPKEATFEERTADVYAWNPVVLHRPARCERCFTALDRGLTAHLGLSQDPSAAPRWLCAACLQAITSP